MITNFLYAFIYCHFLNFKMEKPIHLLSFCLVCYVINHHLLKVPYRLPHCIDCFVPHRFSQVEMPSLNALKEMSYGFALPVWNAED